MIEKIRFELARNKQIGSLQLQKIAVSLYKFMPKNDLEFILVCDGLIKLKDMRFFSIMTLFIKRRKTVLTKQYMKYYDNWIQNYLFSWWSVDQICGRVINHVIESDENLYSYLLEWSDSSNHLVRRTSLVAMIKAMSKLRVYYDYQKMIFLVDKLKNDTEYYVKKGVGWVIFKLSKES